MKQLIEEEREFRRIDRDTNIQFLYWKDRRGTRTGTSTITEKTGRANKNQDVGLKLEGAFMLIKANGSEKKKNSRVAIGHYLTQKVVRPLKIATLLWQ
jgi:hypothetical protein